MHEISLQMINHNVSSYWWKKLISRFIQVGDSFEIRCWKEETSEIQQASFYGKPTEEKDEVSIKGVVSKELLLELLSENPLDKSIYNKMTKYFTINIVREKRLFCSAHYGTEIYLVDISDEDITFFKDAMKDYTEDEFSIYFK